MQDEEHRYDLCLADDSDKAASNVSLYLMMGCVPKKKSNMCSVKALTAEVQALRGCAVALLSP